MGGSRGNGDRLAGGNGGGHGLSGPGRVRGTAPSGGATLLPFLGTCTAIIVVANSVAVWRLRAWNVTSESRARGASTAEAATTRTPSREVWDNPILWREIRTRAYGRMIIVVRIAWLLLFAVAVAGILGEARRPRPDRLAVALAMVPMVLASLVAVTALAVTSVTTERDRGSLDLLLVSDLEPAEFVWGKLLGVLTVAREIVLLPLILCGALVAAGITGLEGGCASAWGWRCCCSSQPCSDSTSACRTTRRGAPSP